MSQREDDNTASVESMKKALGITGGYFTGGQLRAFWRGWAVCIWGGNRAHFWYRSQLDIAWVRSQCGREVTVASLYGEGNFPRCKRCAAGVGRK